MLTIDDNVEMAYKPKEYESNVKSKDVMNCKLFFLVLTLIFDHKVCVALQKMIEKLEDDYKEQLKKKDIETFELKKDLSMVRYELREAQRRLELPMSMQLAEARKKIQSLEEKLKQKDDSSIIEVKVDPPEASSSNSPSEKKLRAQLEASNKKIEKLQAELEKEKERAKEKEMEYRRLIAASCGLPIEKVDALVKPLTLVIESDPPDYDMTRVIGLMDANNNNSSNSNNNSPLNKSL